MDFASIVIPFTPMTSLFGEISNTGNRAVGAELGEETMSRLIYIKT